MSAANTCNAPQQYYSCDSANGGFKGCCKANACYINGCPDNDQCDSQNDTPCGPICCAGTTPCIGIGVCQGGAADSAGNDEPITNAPSVVTMQPVQVATTSTSQSLTNAGPLVSGSLASMTGSTNTLASFYPGASATLQPTILPSSDHAKAGTIAGAAVGGVGALAIALVIGLFFFRRKRNKRKQMQRVENPQPPAWTANEFGVAAKNEKGSPSHESAYQADNATTIISPISPLTPSPYHTPTSPDTLAFTNNGRPRPPDLEMVGSTEFHQELSGEPTTGISELSPDPERDLINAPMPKQGSANAGADVTSNAGTVYPAQASGMRPNLDPDDGSGIDNRYTQGSNRAHVMSFMDYDANSQGPVR